MTSRPRPPSCCARRGRQVSLRSMVCCWKSLSPRAAAGGQLAGDGGVEGQAAAVDRGGHLRRRIAPADAQRRQAVQLREGVGDHDVGLVAGELQAVVEGRVEAELAVGPVEDQQHAGGQGGVQALYLAEGDPGASGVAGIGQEDQPRAVVDALQELVHVDAEAGLLGAAHLGLAGQRADGEGGEAVLALDHVVARLQEGLVEEREHLVGAAAEDQPLGLDAIGLGDRGADDRGARVRIDVQAAVGRGVGLVRLGAGAQRVLVGRQLHRLSDARRAGLARHIGVDVQDARLRHRLRGLGSIEGLAGENGGGLGHDLRRLGRRAWRRGARLSCRRAPIRPRARAQLRWRAEAFGLRRSRRGTAKSATPRDAPSLAAARDPPATRETPPALQTGGCERSWGS